MSGRSRRAEFVAGLEESDPTLVTALTELRATNPQAYRKAIRRMEAGRDPTDLTGVSPAKPKKKRSTKKKAEAE